MSLLIDAIQARSDDRGFCRTTLGELAQDTALSTRTIRRLLSQYETDGLIQKRAKLGNSGGLLLRIPNRTPNRTQTGHQTGQTGQTGQTCHAFPQGAGPEGALSPLLRDPKPDTKPDTNRTPAYRPIGSHETALSGAKLVYTGDDIVGRWRRISATYWEAPNNDTVSIRSMTPELRLRLRVDLNDDGTECVEAVRAVRGMLNS